MIPAQTTNTLNKQPFGKTSDGQEVYVYTLRNSSGVQVKITNFGGRITSILAPDKNGKFDDVVLGFDSLDGYLAKPASSAYFGAVIGRYANRLAHGTFTLDGKTYHIPTNDGPNTLHAPFPPGEGRAQDGSRLGHQTDSLSMGSRPSLPL